MRPPTRAVPILIACLLAVFVVALVDPALAKRRSHPVVPPGLRILDLTLSPDPYRVGEGSLQLQIAVELPADVDPSSLLEVSALIASPSKRSMRFLVSRQPVVAYVTGSVSKPRISVTLFWDGTDQMRRQVTEGRYTYEVKAKLLSVGSNGPRTQMLSWPKRGTVTVSETNGEMSPR